MTYTKRFSNQNLSERREASLAPGLEQRVHLLDDVVHVPANKLISIMLEPNAIYLI